MKKLPPIKPRRLASHSAPALRRRTVLPNLPLYAVSDENIDCQRLGMDWLWFEKNTVPHGWMKTDAKSWSHENRWLASRAGVDDDALLELLRRDPRYFASPTVVARIFRWKLDLLRAQIHYPGADSGTENKAATKRADKARDKLKQLAHAICFVTGSGNQQVWSLPRIRRDYLEALAKVHTVRAALSRLPSVSQSDIKRLAAAEELAPRFVADISASDSKVRSIAHAILADRYGRDEETLRRQVRLALKLPPEKPRRRIEVVTKPGSILTNQRA